MRPELGGIAWGRGPRCAVRVILLVSAVCIFAAVIALYARSAILDEAPFADRAVATLAQDEVAEEIAQRFTDGVVERSPGS